MLIALLAVLSSPQAPRALPLFLQPSVVALEKQTLSRKIMGLKPEVTWKTMRLEFELESKTDWKFRFEKKF